MGLKVKRKFYSSNMENYFRISDIHMVCVNEISNKNIEQNYYWEVTLKLYVNKEARDCIKLHELIKENKIKNVYDSENKDELAYFNNIWGAYINEDTTSAPVWNQKISLSKHIFTKNNCPFTLKGKTIEEIYILFYNRCKELGGFLGANHIDDMIDDIETEEEFIFRITKRIKKDIKDIKDGTRDSHLNKIGEN